MPEQSLLHLKEILSGKYQRVLPEFMAFLKEQQWLLPAEFLPELLDECLKDRQLWTLIQPLLGNRAAWLMELHPDWGMLMPRADPSHWAGAGPEARKRILAYLRRTDPATGADLLAAAWGQLHYRQKAAMLELMQEGLGPHDEVFLENCLEDSRKEVRLRAADLLASLPDSRLAERLFQGLIPLFTFAPGSGNLTVALPREIPEQSRRDGIHPTPTSGRNGSLKEQWLAECVSRIPPARWHRHFNWDAEALVAAFAASKRADLLLAALAEAVLRFEDEPAGAELMRLFILKNVPMPENVRWQALARQLPASLIQDMAGVFFQQQPGLLEEQHLLTRVLELGAHAWDAVIARQVVQGLKQWMVESKTFFWNLWHYKRLLEAAGYCCPTELFEEVNADWPTSSPVWNQWAPDVERMLRILRFRIEMKGSKETGTTL